MRTYLDDVMADRPAMLWPLSESSGTVARDVSGNARHGTYTGSPVLRGGSVVPGHACPLFGNGRYVVSASSLVLGNAFTLECWMHKDSHIAGYPGDINSVIGNLFAGNNGALVRFDGAATLRFYWATGASYASLTATSPRFAQTRQTSHIVAAARNGWAYLMVNGTVVAEGSTSAPSGFNGGLRVASSEDGRFIGAKLGWAAAYNSYLDQSVARRHWQAGIRPALPSAA